MATRTTILYDGAEYVVARHAEDIKAEVEGLLATGKAGWLVVNHGRGALKPAELLIMPGVSMSLIDTSDPD